jgi:NADH:ubiquinone oxidoreductase subunit F (NADH-binding)
MSDTVQNRIFAAGSNAGHADHLRVYGPFDPKTKASGLVGDLHRSGLTGRGGAGFSTWRKLLATDDAHSNRRPVVIGNAAEGEPRSVKDLTLVIHAPHLVIDGMLAAAAALRAHRLYLYTSADGIESLNRAIAERDDASRIRVVEAPDTFVSGEASAVVRGIETGVALPQDRTRRLSESGLKRRPTLVQNVETLAHIALVARYGAAWFRRAGTERDPGTRLVTVSGDVPSERVLEVPGDARISDILSAAGADPTRLAAVLTGGYHGAWVPRRHLDAPLSAPGLAPFGANPGAGVLYALGRHRCGLRATAEILDYLAAESARQCGPCRFGLPAMAELMTAIAVGNGDPGLADRLEEIGASITGRGSCHHPNGTARLALSALATFDDDVHAHLSGRCLRTAHP